MEELKAKAVRFWDWLSATHAFRVLHQVQLLYGEVEVSVRAGSFAYYALFSIFPLIALMLTFGSLFFSREEISNYLLQATPPGGQIKTVIEETFDKFQRARGTVSIVSVFVFLWASLRFFQSLVHAVNRAWHSEALPWWHVPLKNLAMVFVMASALIFGLFAPTVLSGLVNFSYAYLPHILEGFVLETIKLTRLGLATVILFYAFSMLYMLSPRKRVKFRDVWVSALGVTIILQLLQTAFVTIIPRLLNYSAVYGTVGTLMFLMMWLYLSGTVVIVGACFSAALKQASNRPDDEEDTAPSEEDPEIQEADEAGADGVEPDPS